MYEIFNAECSESDNRKYELLPDTERYLYEGARPVYRIRALRDFGDVKKGDIGGWVESEYNLSHLATCWIHDECIVHGSARVEWFAQLKGCIYFREGSLITDNSIIHSGKNELVEFTGTIITGETRIEHESPHNYGLVMPSPFLTGPKFRIFSERIHNGRWAKRDEMLARHAEERRQERPWNRLLRAISVS